MRKKKLAIGTVITTIIVAAVVLTMLTTNLFASSEIIRDEETPGRYTKNGPYSYKTFSMSTSNKNTVYYPTTAKAPFSGIVYCPPYTATQEWLSAWGPFFASHGIVLVTFDTTTTMDSVDSRANQQKKVLNALKNENTRSNSPLYGKLATDRIGAMGWSMGGGATWINSAEYANLKTAMTLAGHNMTAVDLDSKGRNTKCPTLIFNGAVDMTMLGGMGQSKGVYDNIPRNVPKVIYEVATTGHMTWKTPTQADDDVAALALAFQKTYLDGDTRWKSYITKPRTNVATWKSNIN